MTTTRIKSIRTLEELDAIKAIWTDLERLDGGPSIFQSWIWNRTWCDHVLYTRKKARLDVRVVEDGAGRILAILPFFEESLVGPMARITQFLCHQESTYNDILLSDPRSSELANEVIHLLLKDLGPRAVLHLRHLYSESTFTKQLIAMQIVEPQCKTVQLRADPTITDQSKRLGKSNRKHFRSSLNRLRRQFDIKFRVRSGADILSAFDNFIDLHCRRFASIGRVTLLSGPKLAFLRAATAALSITDNFEIIELTVDDKAIASLVMVHDKKRYFSLQGGFDPEFSRFSPILLLDAEAMRRGFEELGCEIYDLGAGYQDYKFNWKPVIGADYFCCHGGTGPYAKTVAALYRVAFRYRVSHTT